MTSLRSYLSQRHCQKGCGTLASWNPPPWLTSHITHATRSRHRLSVALCVCVCVWVCVKINVCLLMRCVLFLKQKECAGVHKWVEFKRSVETQTMQSYTDTHPIKAAD